MQEWVLAAGGGILLVGLLAGYIIGFHNGAVAGELRALKSMRFGRSSSHRESRAATLPLREEA